MKKTVVKILTITIGVIAALAAIAGVAYLIRKKLASKGVKKYVSCPQDEAEAIDEFSDEEVIEGFADEEIAADAE